MVVQRQRGIGNPAKYVHHNPGPEDAGSIIVPPFSATATRFTMNYQIIAGEGLF